MVADNTELHSRVQEEHEEEVQLLQTYQEENSIDNIPLRDETKATRMSAKQARL